VGTIQRDKILERVKNIVIGEIGDANVKVYLFGSWARGEERRSSDIDIAVDWPGGAPPARLACLREVLEESDVLFRVDVVDLSVAGEGLVNKVRKEGVLWKG
jgi:predicted nucleotidyltransferase